MKYIEKIGELTAVYEGTPKEIMELQNMINPKMITVNNTFTDKELSDNEELRKQFNKYCVGTY